MGCKISLDAETYKLSNSQPFWLVFLACLEKPRNLWEISKIYGFMREGTRQYANNKTYKVKEPTSRIYNWKMIKQMVQKGFLEGIPDKKSTKYLSKLSPFGIEKEFVDLLERDWVRSKLFPIEEIKHFFKAEELGLEPLRNGIHFLNFVKEIMSFTVVLRLLEEKGNSAHIQMIENNFPGMSFCMEYNAFEYKLKARKIIEEHKEEVCSALKDIIKEVNP